MLIEQDMAPPLDVTRYFVLARDEAEDEEAISCWNEGDGDWSSDKEFNAPSNEGLSWDIIEAIRVWGPLKDEDQSMELQTLFKEKDEKESDTT